MNGGNGSNGPNVIVVNSNQLRSLFPNAHTNLSSNITHRADNSTGSAQVLKIRQNNGVHVQGSINESQHPKRSIQGRFIDGEFSQSSKFISLYLPVVYTTFNILNINTRYLYSVMLKTTYFFH